MEMMPSHPEDIHPHTSMESSTPPRTREAAFDADERRRVECELRTRAFQQETLVRLGRQALSNADLNSLLKEAVDSAGRILEVDYCEVLELLPGKDKLIFRACRQGLGNSVDGLTVDVGLDSLAGYTLMSGGPVVMGHIETETRFWPHYLMREQGIVSGLSVVIGNGGGAFGVLGAHSMQPRVFSNNDINFLQVVANILAAAIERRQAEESLLKSGQAAKRLAEEKAVMAEIGRIISSTLDIEDIYERFSEEVRKIIAFDRITITRLVQEKACSRILYTSGPAIPEREPHGEYPLAGTMSERMLTSKRGLVCAPLTEEQLAASFPGILAMWSAGYRSFMIAPLISRDQVIGALVLSSYTTGNYTAADLTLAENVASQISGAIANAHLFHEHRQMAAALRESEASLRSIFLAAPIGIGLVSNRVLLQVNERVCQMVGRTREELIGNSSRILYATDEEFEYVGREKYDQIRKRGTGTVETRWQHKSGELTDVLLSSTPLDPDDWASGVTFTALDITESKRSELARKDLEDKLRQAQKMEAIGTLAGGIAHDFNNILAAIIGFAELAKLEASGNMDLGVSINEVLNASFRARDLVRQILTFSRQTETESGPIQIHLIVKEALKLLRASLPSTIQLRAQISSCGTIMGDPTQIHQVVMNLCTNAYQAMRESGGLLEVGVSETWIGPSSEADLKQLNPGPHLRLSVRDTGQGIEPAIIHRIFDPYFTTKEKGKGTGLGLAVVHGIVKGHRGAIQVESEPGRGTRFDIYFPMLEMSRADTAAAREEVTASGREKILFVDDEPALEELGKRLIGSLGYKVCTCGNAADALEKFRTSAQDFDLVITDMTMPCMTGNRLAAELMRIRPGIPVIVCTGFSEQINKENAQAQGIKAIIMKPFLKGEIAAVIRDVLDRRPA